MADTSAKVFNIPASAPFLRTLVRALLSGEIINSFRGLGDPLALARLTLYLPTRRACRLAREEFLSINSGLPSVLPRMVPIGDIDEDELIFAQAAAGPLAETALALPRQLEPLERRLLLAQLVTKWAASPDVRGAGGTPLVANAPAAALALADDLARLIDDMITRKVDWSRLDNLVAEKRHDLDQYWQKSIALLKLVRRAWPGVLDERGAIEAAERRDLLIEAESQRLSHDESPVIAAGSTGSMPATAKLIATIARLPNGAVVLPGLDVTLDDASWRSLAGARSAWSDKTPTFGHAQFAMQGLLTTIGINREGVKQLALAKGREAFMSEVLRPAATTELWPKSSDRKFSAEVDRALAGISVIEAANAEEEALTIAVALREAEHEGKSAALITPDRGLARRVLASLERWNVPVDDSAGDPLADAPAGVFARLAAEAALGGLAPVTLLALLKHPLCRLGAAEGGNARAVAALERAVLRGPRPKAGSKHLARVLMAFRIERQSLHRNDPRKLVSDAQLDLADILAGKLATAVAPLEDLAHKRASLRDFATAHRDVLKLLSKADDGTVHAFINADGKKLELALDELIDTAASAELELPSADYAEFFQTALASQVVRLREQPGVHVRILGPLEARLQHVDRVVLGGLNEGIWPPETRSDPWLSRPMRLALGLDLPERRIGLAAHDFAQALGVSEVILSRATKVAGAPTVASRFVQRIAALAGDRWKDAKKRGDRYLAFGHALDAPQSDPKPVPRPAPLPPGEARPSQLSVTDIEHWLRDPYTIYAKHVLRLAPLDPVDAAPGAADRGSAIHDAIGNFTKAFAAALPAAPEQELLTRGEESFAALADYPEAQAFWWPRFKRIARWFVGWEKERRPALAAVYGEINGRLQISLQGKTKFTLTARADRIERRQDGRYVIVDYKTGAPPTSPQVRSGMAPQLTLEAAILRYGEFEGVARGPVAEVTYVRLRGGDPAGEPKTIDFDDDTLDAYADIARAKLTEIATKFLLDGQPYRSLVHPMWKKQYSEYDHLARVKEWASSGGESEYDLWSQS
jgi:ATP-dependent helicase/nuclease subunit B